MRDLNQDEIEELAVLAIAFRELGLAGRMQPSDTETLCVLMELIIAGALREGDARRIDKGAWFHAAEARTSARIRAEARTPDVFRDDARLTRFFAAMAEDLAARGPS